MQFITTLKKLFWVSRPVSWLNTAYPFAAGYVLAIPATYGLYIPSFTTLIIGSLYFLIAYNLLMYGVNDIFDYESDILNPRKGGIEGMREERRFHPAIARAAVILNLPPLIYLYAVSRPSAALVLSFVVFMVLAYSLKYLRFKERPILDSFTSSCHFVGPLVFGLALAGGKLAVIGGWPYIVGFFLWGMASHAFGAVQDIIPDRNGKLSSIATVLGAKATVRLTAVLYLAATIIVASQGGVARVVGLTGLIYVINVIGYSFVSDADSASTNQAWKRFIWLNYFTGFVVTACLIIRAIS